MSISSFVLLFFVMFGFVAITLQIDVSPQDFHAWQCTNICTDAARARAACNAFVGHVQKGNVCQTYDMIFSDRSSSSHKVAVCEMDDGTTKCITTGDGANSLIVWDDYGGFCHASYYVPNWDFHAE